MPTHLLHFGQQISSAPSSTLREIWGTVNAISNFADQESDGTPTLITVWTDNLVASHILTTGYSRNPQISHLVSLLLAISKKEDFILRFHFHYRTQFLARIPDFLSNVIFPNPSNKLLLKISSGCSTPIARLRVVQLNFNFLTPGKMIHFILSKDIPVFVIPLGLHPRLIFRLIEVLIEFCPNSLWNTPPLTNSRWFSVFFANKPRSYVTSARSYWSNNYVDVSNFRYKFFLVFYPPSLL